MSIILSVNSSRKIRGLIWWWWWVVTEEKRQLVFDRPQSAMRLSLLPPASRLALPCPRRPLHSFPCLASIILLQFRSFPLSVPFLYRLSLVFASRAPRPASLIRISSIAVVAVAAVKSIISLCFARTARNVWNRAAPQPRKERSLNH